MDGLEVAMADALVSSQPEGGGPPITRRRYSYAPNTVQFRWKMSRAQVQTFEAFFRDDLKMGSLAFTYKDEVTDANGDFKFLASQPPRWSRAGPNLFFLSATAVRL